MHPETKNRIEITSNIEDITACYYQIYVDQMRLDDQTKNYEWNMPGKKNVKEGSHRSVCTRFETEK